MKSNIDKFLPKSLSTYFFLLVIIFIMKLVGLDYFGIDLNNPMFVNVSNLATKYGFKDLWYACTMEFYLYMFISISCEDNNKRMKLFILFVTPLTFLVKYVNHIINFTAITYFIEMFYMLILCFIYNKLYKKLKFRKIFRNYILFVIINTFFQLISCITRVNYITKTDFNFITNIILDFDYIILLIIYYKIYFKGGNKICLEMEVGLSSLKKINLKKLLKKLHQNWLNFKNQSKQIKLEILIFIVLSLIWNVLNVVLILFVAFLNHTFIECIFILTSFWLSKRQFGKPFHLKSMSQCFVVSNLTYYILNRVTTPLGISIFIPILLGVSLSYFTSKLVKSENPKLYRGIPIDEFDKKILKVTDKNSLHYKICYMYYIERKSELEISHKTNYGIDNIKKIKSKINKNIEKLQ